MKIGAGPFVDRQRHGSVGQFEEACRHAGAFERGGEAVELEAVFAAVHRAGDIQPQRQRLTAGRQSGIGQESEQEEGDKGAHR